MSTRTETIKQGDTLSQIAQREGTTVEELQKLNQNITDPNKIFAGDNIILPSLEITEEAAQSPSVDLPITTDEQILEVTEDDIPDTLDLQDIETANISEELETQRELREGISRNLVPTTLETDLQNRILDIREMADEIELEQKEDLLELEKGGIGTMAGFNIAEESLSKRDALKLEALQREEANLLSRLGLRQEAREFKLKSYESLLENSQENIDIAFKIQNRIAEEKEAQLQREEDLTFRQRKNLDDMMGLISGIDPNTLEPATQSELARLSAQAGIPFDVVMGRLKLDYNERIADLMPDADTPSTQTERQLEKEKKAAAKIEQSLDKFLNVRGEMPDVIYNRLKSIWAKNLGTPERFDEIFGLYRIPEPEKEGGSTGQTSTFLKSLETETEDEED